MPNRGRPAPAGTPRPRAERGGGRARRRQRLPRQAGGHAAARTCRISAARLVLPAIVPPFLAAYPEMRLEVVAEESFVDVLAAGCDAGIRYDDRLEQDMIAVPIGPRVQRYGGRGLACLPRPPRAARAPARRCSDHACLRGRFPSGAMPPWEFERGQRDRCGSSPPGPLLAQGGRGHRSRRGRGDRRHGHRLPVRGLAAPAFRAQRRAGARARTLVAPRSPGRFSTTPGGAWCPRR